MKIIIEPNEDRRDLNRIRLGDAIRNYSIFTLHKYYCPDELFCIKQWFDLNEIYTHMYEYILKKFTIRWGKKHKCKYPGCGDCAVIDANHKCKTVICANPDGDQTLDLLGIHKIPIGCTRDPATKKRLCKKCFELKKQQVVLGTRTTQSLDEYRKVRKNYKDESDSEPDGDINMGASNNNNGNNVSNDDDGGNNISNEDNIVDINDGQVDNGGGNDKVAWYNEKFLSGDQYLIEKIVSYNGEYLKKNRKYTIKWLNWDKTTEEPYENIDQKWIKKFHQGGNVPLQVWKSEDTQELNEIFDIGEDKAQVKCNTDKEIPKKDDPKFVKQKRMVGCGTVMWPCGIVLYCGMFFRSESSMQWIRHWANIVQWCEWKESKKPEDFSIFYDDACHLAQVLRNPKRHKVHEIWEWLSRCCIYLDRMHAKNHCVECRKNFQITKGDVKYKLVNTQVCESLYRWLSSYKHIICNMNLLDFEWFLLRLCHWRNVEIEKSLNHSYML